MKKRFSHLPKYILALCSCIILLLSIAPLSQAASASEDEPLHILMIGNSFSYYFTDELFHIAAAAGVPLDVYNVYYSGCSLEDHWTWWKEGSAHYSLRHYDENGLSVSTSQSLENCLAKEDWDVITFQDSNKWIRSGGVTSGVAHLSPYLDELLAHIRSRIPDATCYWHHTWAYQTGYNRNGFQISTPAEQYAYQEQIKAVSLFASMKYGLPLIPSGDAWQIARTYPILEDNLCGTTKEPHGDYYHDGNIGGGQYLNACVWFETLTGQSCIGNSYRPAYALSEEKVTVLQQAAHEAVKNCIIFPTE